MKSEDKRAADEMIKKGFPYTAAYLRKFGIDAWNPNFIYGVNAEVEAFYKKCVEQNKRWDKVKI